MSDPRPYAVYWSVYTDLRGRTQFRDLYWDKLKDLIGRPAKLVGIEREKWLGSEMDRELRCHVWRHFRAMSDAEGVLESIRAMYRIAPVWQLLDAPIRQPRGGMYNDELFEAVWYRDWHEESRCMLPLPRLTTVMVSVMQDSGFRIGKGYTVNRTAASDRPLLPVVVQPEGTKRAFLVRWRIEVQTSTKRELMDIHKSNIERRFGPDAKLVEVDKRGGDVGPFNCCVQRRFNSLSDEEMCFNMLLLSGGLLQLREAAPDGSIAKLRGLEGHRQVSDPYRLLGSEAVPVTEPKHPTC